MSGKASVPRLATIAMEACSACTFMFNGTQCPICQTPRAAAVVATPVAAPIIPVAVTLDRAAAPWDCELCGMTGNDATYDMCEACGAENPGAAAAEDRGAAAARAGNDTVSTPEAATWKCHVCTCDNSSHALSCSACATPKQRNVAESKAADEWRCPMCTASNPGSESCCSICHKLRPGYWKCSFCTVHNAPSRAGCSACGKAGGSLPARLSTTADANAEAARAARQSAKQKLKDARTRIDEFKALHGECMKSLQVGHLGAAERSAMHSRTKELSCQITFFEALCTEYQEV